MFGKEWRKPVCHLVQHHPKTPPVRLAAIPICILVIDTRIMQFPLTVFHFQSHQSFLVCLENFWGNIVTSAAGHQTIPLGQTLTPVRTRGQQRCSRTEINEKNVRIWRQY